MNESYARRCPKMLVWSIVDQNWVNHEFELFNV